MNISGIKSINNLGFTSRRSDVKKADDIQRKAKATFPMISLTYAAKHYKSYESQKYSPLRKKILDMRFGIVSKDKEEKLKDKECDGVLYAKELELCKLLKIGNCAENAMAALAALTANGYYNSQKASLCANFNFVNKKTGELEYDGVMHLGHCFAVTDMNKGGKMDIVVDPWLGFVGTEDCAIARYKQYYDLKNDYTSHADHYFSFLENEKFMEGKTIKREDYDCHSRIVIVPDEVGKYTLEKIGAYARENFEGVLLDDEA